MTARTQIPAANILAGSRDTFQSPPTALAAATTMYIQGGATGGAALQDFRRLLVFCVIGTTATTVTLRASGNGVDASGNAQPTANPANTVFTGATAGDLVSASTTSGTLILGPLTTDRFLQPDGNVYLDFSQATGVTVYAVQLPFNVA